MTIREREKILNELVTKNHISVEDKKLCRFIFGLLKNGDNLTAVLKWTKLKKHEVLKWHKNLKASGYFKDGKICISESFYKGKDQLLEIILMLTVAHGFVKRRTVKEK